MHKKVEMQSSYLEKKKKKVCMLVLEIILTKHFIFWRLVVFCFPFPYTIYVVFKSCCNDHIYEINKYDNLSFS